MFDLWFSYYQYHYKYLIGKIAIYNQDFKSAKEFFLEIVNNDNENYIKLLAYYELIKNKLINDTDNLINSIYSKDNLNKLINKRTPLECLYIINSLFNDTINLEDFSLAKYLLDLEIQFINAHDCYRYLPIYYQNKIKFYKDDYRYVKDLENKLLSFENIK